MSALILVAFARAQFSSGWTTTSLHPTEADYSIAQEVWSGRQVGYANYGDFDQATMWFGTSASTTLLSPNGSVASASYALDENFEYGWANFGGSTYHASVWSGSSASWTSISPPARPSSFVWGASGGQQAGEAELHASLWSGTAASWVDLHPAGADFSVAFDVQGGQQVGYANLPVVGNHASLWQGTSASWVDLNPVGASLSIARGVYGGQQVGMAVVGGVTRASMWTDSAASWVDLTPSGLNGDALDAFDGIQVGEVSGGNLSGIHASLWTGSASSWVNLSDFLPMDYRNPQGGTSAHARGVWTDGITTHVVGDALNFQTGEVEAMMWTHVVPEPIAFVPFGIGVVGLALRRKKRSNSNLNS
jgi:hypothetical protein